MECLGQWVCEDATIYIQQGYANDELKQTFFHEVLECISSNLGVNFSKRFDSLDSYLFNHQELDQLSREIMLVFNQLGR